MADNPLEIIQRSSYYAFGLELPGLNAVAADPEMDYKYNGKELNSEFALGWSNYGARFYDPSIARFTGVDPIAESYPHVTVYNYAENRPIDGIDLWGLQYVNFNMKAEVAEWWNATCGTNFRIDKPSSTTRTPPVVYGKIDLSAEGNVVGGMGIKTRTPFGKVHADIGTVDVFSLKVSTDESYAKIFASDNYVLKRDLSGTINALDEIYIGVGIE